MTLNLAQRSFKVIDFGTNRKWSIGAWTLSCTILEICGLNAENRHFPYPLLFRLKFGGVPFGVHPSYWGRQRAKALRLSAVKLNYFPRIPTYMTTMPQRHRETDGQTDGHVALARVTRNSAKLTNQRVSCAFTSSPFSFHIRYILPTSKFEHSYYGILPCDAMRCTVFVIVILSVRPSVRASVRHTRGLCPHGSTCDHDFFTIW